MQELTVAYVSARTDHANFTFDNDEHGCNEFCRGLPGYSDQVAMMTSEIQSSNHQQVDVDTTQEQLVGSVSCFLPFPFFSAVLFSANNGILHFASSLNHMKSLKSMIIMPLMFVQMIGKVYLGLLLMVNCTMFTSSEVEISFGEVKCVYLLAMPSVGGGALK